MLSAAKGWREIVTGLCMTSRADRDAAVARMAQFAGSAQSVREHLGDILESPVFRGSHRSREFLTYVVEKAVSGDIEALKERVIGVELFGRTPSYDTSEDAIVRVAANEVRKKLLRYYESDGAKSAYRILLASGSYIPEFSRAGIQIPSLKDPAHASNGDPTWNFAGEDRIGARIGVRRYGWFAGVFALGMALGILLAGRGQWHSTKAVLPWSALFQGSGQNLLVCSDTSLNMLEEYLDTSVSVSEYANRQLVGSLNLLSSEKQQVARLLGGPDFTTSTSPVDAAIAAKIAEVAASYSRHFEVRAARQLYARDFKTDGNFILLGSPRSNPWTSLFQDRLDFSFVFDPVSRIEKIQNHRPRPGESGEYVPAARGGGTGEAYAITAFVPNLEQKGNVLIIAGSSAEATAAAAYFVTDLPGLTETLRRHGIEPAGQPRYFEVLLRVTTMAGSSTRRDVISLHAIDYGTTR